MSTTEESRPVIVEDQPIVIPVSEETTNTPPTPERTWVEEVEVAGSQLVERVKELVAEGKVRRLIIRNAEDKVIIEIPLTAGVAVGGVVTFFAPILAALAALAAVLTRVKIQIIRAEE